MARGRVSNTYASLVAFNVHRSLHNTCTTLPPWELRAPCAARVRRSTAVAPEKVHADPAARKLGEKPIVECLFGRLRLHLHASLHATWHAARSVGRFYQCLDTHPWRMACEASAELVGMTRTVSDCMEASSPDALFQGHRSLGSADGR